jgi:putative SOS response-associated peptidase YedK
MPALAGDRPALPADTGLGEINKNTAPVYSVNPIDEVPFVTVGDNGDHRLREGRWWLVPWWGAFNHHVQ